ncbi:hypothetical protein PTTG_06036 [Puccinia triticina 1-1 BBBD Race 1]|uniref:DDE Tnp4 domain-containing protein n=1 Tax=Puccinia triticina (isolate 1-1 / race 1 (BBBD)) TaxID=630390 RepID=A0A180G8Z2_PUCT1|nr:hypothetical protein PTTG_06036 [Puccinia triticina 1-1 BBBD Race 1]
MKARNNWAYVTTMGVDVATFEHILSRFKLLWNTATLPRSNVNPNGEPQVGCWSLDAAGCLGLVLHWLCSTMVAYTLQQIFGMTPDVCSCYLDWGLDCLLQVLKNHPQACIIWPSTEEQIQPYARTIKKKFPLLENCFGFLDGLKLPICVAEDEGCVIAFAPNGTIIYAVLNAPGSWHDSAIAVPLYNQLLNHTPKGYRIISDTAFPRNSERLQRQILAPVKRGDWLPGTPRLFLRMKSLNKEVVLA